jgi:hypothetical protein
MVSVIATAIPGIVRLARAVIRQALEDWRKSYRDAGLFIASPDFDWWCMAGQLDPEVLRAALSRLKES